MATKRHLTVNMEDGHNATTTRPPSPGVHDAVTHNMKSIIEIDEQTYSTYHVIGRVLVGPVFLKRKTFEIHQANYERHRGRHLSDDQGSDGNPSFLELLRTAKPYYERLSQSLSYSNWEKMKKESVEFDGVKYLLPDNLLWTHSSRHEVQNILEKRIRLVAESCHAAYCTDECQFLLKNNIPISNIRHFEEDFKCQNIKDHSAAVLVVSEQTKTLVLSFRGTHSRRQLINQIRTARCLATIPFLGDGKMMKFYTEAASYLWPKIKEAFTELMSQDHYRDYNIIVSGYSMGAVLAKWTFAKIVHESLCPTTRFTLVTFGEPASGDMKIAFEIKKLGLPYYRVMNKFDLIPHITPWFEHTGIPVVIGKFLSEVREGFLADGHGKYLEIKISSPCIPEEKIVEETQNQITNPVIEETHL